LTGKEKGRKCAEGLRFWGKGEGKEGRVLGKKRGRGVVYKEKGVRMKRVS